MKLMEENYKKYNAMYEELIKLRAENEELRNGLKYFACFKCDDDVCDCPNCKAHKLVSQSRVDR